MVCRVCGLTKEGEERGKREGICHTYCQIVENKYHKDAHWIKECNHEELERLGKYILEDLSLEELKDKVKQ